MHHGDGIPCSTGDGCASLATFDTPKGRVYLCAQCIKGRQWRDEDALVDEVDKGIARWAGYPR